MQSREVDPEELRQLTEIFRRAGADDPESWAKSQLAEGIPQLAIFSFLKALWKGVVQEDDHQWIESEIRWSKQSPNGPCTQGGVALQEMREKGVSPQAITDLVRVFQYSILYHACSLLDDSRVEDVPITDWVLHQVDDDGNPIAIIQGLHEVLLSMDPTGREMRPRPEQNS